MHSTRNHIVTWYSWEGLLYTKVFLLQATAVKGFYVFSLQGDLYILRNSIKNGSHKLTGAMHILGPTLDAMNRRLHCIPRGALLRKHLLSDRRRLMPVGHPVCLWGATPSPRPATGPSLWPRSRTLPSWAPGPRPIHSSSFPSLERSARPRCWSRTP